MESNGAGVESSGAAVVVTCVVVTCVAVTCVAVTSAKPVTTKSALNGPGACRGRSAALDLLVDPRFPDAGMSRCEGAAWQRIE